MHHNILPQPNGRVEFSGESIPLPRRIAVKTADFAPEPLAVFAQRAGVELAQEGAPLLRLYRNTGFPSEAYRLRITTKKGIQIEAATEQGLCWALATLYQLTEDGRLPACDIADQPQYAHRGLLLDCVRHFFSVETVKAFIEAISLVKINKLHWHLTDDQGWRIESKRFPILHENCGEEYYTQAQIRDIVAFAQARGVEVYPEFDLPGHTTAILSVMPELGCAGKKVRLGDAPGIYSVLLCPGKEEVFNLLLPLIDEIADLFPSPYFHLGGDEAPKIEWQSCPDCQRRIREKELASEEELQGWFTARLAAHLRTLGKKPICWNESLLSKRLPEEVDDLTIQYWAEMHQHGSTRRFWETGGKVIFSDMLNAYIDYPHGSIPLKSIYAYAPGLPCFHPKKPLPALGLEATLWTEFIATPERLAQRCFPRAYALAEAAWTQPSCKSYADFRRRLDAFLAHNPGPGYTPPNQTDPRLPQRYRERIAFSRTQLSAPKPENNGGLGGAMDIAWLLRWIKYYFA